jgi:hypothetical protein
LRSFSAAVRSLGQPALTNATAADEEGQREKGRMVFDAEGFVPANDLSAPSRAG